MAPQLPQSIARYQIIRTLGEGGMGSVYLAKDPAIDRFVAIKLLRSGFDDESMRERFRREAKAVGQLHHINIVTIFDVGEHEGDPFIAMEYVEGRTVGQIIRAGDDIPLASALHWMDGLCSGLSYAHRRGIVHRDIKPANLVVDEESKVKILDFGIARGPASGMTQVGMLMGTLNYMSPEQLSGKPVDHRSDIFAVGGVFYELLTGRQAFPGDINSGVLHKILMGQAEPVRQINPLIPDEVVTIVERCLAKEPAGRYEDLEAMRRELGRARAKFETYTSDATIRMPRPSAGPGGRAGRTPGEATRAELMRQRRERINQHLTSAREAIAARELGVAADACNQALILDPENVEAFELQERIERLEQAQQWLAEAKNEADRGALTAAALLLDRVAELDAEAPEAAVVREKIAAERRRIEELQRRARVLQEALSLARTELGRDRLDAARAAVAEAVAIEKDHPEAAALLKAIADRDAEKQRQAEEARAREAIADAQHRFAAGEHEAAVATLKAYAPRHPLVDDARSALEFERREIQRREAEERRRQEAKRREDEERQRQEAERKAAEERARREAEERARLEAKRREEEERRRQEIERKAAEERARLEAKRREEAERARQQEEAEKTVVMFPPPVIEPSPPVVEPAPPIRPAPPSSPPPGPPPPASMAAVRSDAAVSVRPTDSTVDLQLPPADLEPVARWPGSRTALISLLGAAAVVVAGAIWWILRPGPPPVPASVLIDIRPWAAVESVVARADNRPIEVGCPATPCLVSLAPGEYHVRARNPFFPNAIEFDLTVTGSGYQEVRRALPDLDPEAEARRILGER